jgi:3-oxoacyl-[acyl-carrier-protein] synthase-3
MATASIRGAQIAGVVSCTPTRVFDNLAETAQFDQAEVRKVVAMAGVSRRRVADADVCSSDLCEAAARTLLDRLGWAPESVDGLVLVTQTPDYFLPSTSCLLHRRLGLSDNCMTFDVGLGCSGYPYGLYLGSMMAGAGGCKRVLVLHGETPTKFTHELDRATFLLFGDAGSATAIERAPDAVSHFSLATDGKGSDDLIVRAGGFRDRFAEEQRRHYLEMNGANLFTFTIKRVPKVVEDVLSAAGVGAAEVDHFILHQSNRFMMQHVCKKVGVPEAKVPYTLAEYGNTGGPSVPLTLTVSLPAAPRPASLRLMLIGYGVGLSWGAAVVDLPPGAPLAQIDYPGAKAA